MEAEEPRFQRQRLPLETRRIIVRMRDDGRTIAEIARTIGRHQETIRSFLARFDRTGRILPDPSGGDQYHRLEEHHKAFMCDVYDMLDGLTLADMQALIIAMFQDDFTDNVAPPSLSTIMRCLNDELKYRLKVAKVEPADYNRADRLESRRTWCENFVAGDIRFIDCIFIDESGFNLHTTSTYGRAALGVRPVRIRPSSRGGNITLAAAMSSAGLISYRAHRQPFTSERFVDWLDDDLLPNLPGSCVILLDNASIHTSVVAEECYRRWPQHTFKFLPPYSPFLNAIEWAFGFIKPHIARQTILGTQALIDSLEEAVRAVDGPRAMGWIENVAGNCLRAVKGQPLGRLYNEGRRIGQINHEHPDNNIHGIAEGEDDYRFGWERRQAEAERAQQRGRGSRAQRRQRRALDELLPEHHLPLVEQQGRSMSPPHTRTQAEQHAERARTAARRQLSREEQIGMVEEQRLERRGLLEPED